MKYATNEENGAEENEVTRAKTYATFSIAKDGVNGEKGYSIGLTDDGMYITDWYNSRVIKYTSADQWATVVVPAWAAGRGGEWDWNSGLTFDGVRGIMYVAYYYQYKVKYLRLILLVFIM